MVSGPTSFEGYHIRTGVAAPPLASLLVGGAGDLGSLETPGGGKNHRAICHRISETISEGA